jgi:hypothetical protein
MRGIKLNKPPTSSSTCCKAEDDEESKYIKRSRAERQWTPLVWSRTRPAAVPATAAHEGPWSCSRLCSSSQLGFSLFDLYGLVGWQPPSWGFLSDGVIVVSELMVKSMREDEQAIKLQVYVSELVLKIEREDHVNLLKNKQSTCRCTFKSSG